MNFKFTNEYPASKIDEIVSFILGPRLWIPNTDYPDFLEWADKSHKELSKESKRALIALSYGNVVGVCVYQKHKRFKDTLEIKNLTVRPDLRGRYLASFLLRNTEIEGFREFKSNCILCDAKANNFEVKFFLLKHKYLMAGSEDLYRLGSGEDVIYKKKLCKDNCLYCPQLVY
ncbi:MAG: GNAT family N-acetyltransferase [Patescibacteria group bacterium]